MEIGENPNVAGSSDDRDSLAAAAEEQPQPIATPRPSNERLDRFAPRTRIATSDGPPDAIRRSAVLSPRAQSASGPVSPTAIAIRAVDLVHDVPTLQRAIKSIFTAPEPAQPILFARTARQLATQFSELNGWTDVDKGDAFRELIGGAAEALDASREPDFERYADAVATFAELIPQMPIGDGLEARYERLCHAIAARGSPKFASIQRQS